MINTPEDSVPLATIDIFRFPVTMFAAIPIVNVAFTAHYNAPRFFMELKDRSIKRFSIVVFVALGISLLVYLATGIAGYLTFGECSFSDILKNYGASYETIVVARVALALLTIFTFPLANNALRSSIVDLWWQGRYTQDNLPRKPFVIITTAVVVFATFIGIEVQQVDVVLAYKGAIFGSFIVYMLPAIIYTQLRKRELEDYGVDKYDGHGSSSHRPLISSTESSLNTQQTAVDRKASASVAFPLIEMFQAKNKWLAGLFTWGAVTLVLGVIISALKQSNSLPGVDFADSAACRTRSVTCRDRFLEPFSSSSIWNTAIGAGAVFSPAELFGDGREPTQFHNDQEFFLRATSKDPEVSWINQGDWSGDNHCKVTGKVVSTIRLPANFTTASDGGRSVANQSNNNAMGILLLDNVTIVQMQPAYRCAAGSPLLARFGNKTDGCPQQFPNVTSVFGDGALGSHGGSGLSAVGGTIRAGELLPSSPPINHALKIELQHQWYYGLQPLAKPTAYNGNRTQYVWPATGSDSGSNRVPGGLYSGTDKNVVPGALLAIPANATVHTATIPGGKIKQALTDYGGYIVDDTGAGNSAAICMEAAVNSEMRNAYGYAMTYPHGVAANGPGAELYADLLEIFRNLHAVTNNGPSSVGGGGTPRRPTKPPICADL